MTGTDSLQELRTTLESLTTEELEAWLRGRLWGRDPIVRDYQAEPSHVLVAKIYPVLSRNAREDIRFAIVAMIGELAHRPTTWPDRAAISLMQAADPILIDSIQRHDVFDPLIRIMLSDSDFHVRFAAAQALVALSYTDTPRFWFDLFAREGPPFSPIVIEGLARTAFDALPSWLISALPHDGVEDALFGLLPFLIERHGAEGVGHVIAQIEFKLSTSGRSRILRFAEAEQIIAPVNDFALALPAAFQAMYSLLSDTTPNGGSNVKDLQRGMMKLRTFLRTHTDRGAIPALLSWEIWSRYVDALGAALRQPTFRAAAADELRGALQQVHATAILSEIGSNSAAALVTLSEDFKAAIVNELALDANRRNAVRQLLADADLLSQDPEFAMLEQAV